MSKKAVTITALLFAVPVVVFYGIVPLVYGARREHLLRSDDPAVVARTIEDMLRSGTSFERAALHRFDEAHDLCALDLERGVGLLAQGETCTEIVGDGAGVRQDLRAEILGVHRLSGSGDDAVFVVRSAGQPAFRRYVLSSTDGVVEGREVHPVDDDDLATWRRDRTWPPGW